MVQKTVPMLVIALLVGAGAGYVFQLPTVNTLQGEVSTLKGQVNALTRANVPVTIPLSQGFFEGGEVLYIVTEASDKGLADDLTKSTGFRVTFSPALAKTPKEALADIFVFTNGIQGKGPLGFQPNVVDSVPGKEGYSSAWSITTVTWSPSVTPKELKSVDEIRAAEAAGNLKTELTPLVVNCPIIKWPTGQMKLETGPITDESPYGAAQVVSIDTQAMKVIFKAHKGWGPDGSTIFYIVTDASEKAVADDLGVSFVPKTRAAAETVAAPDLFVFTNGLKGPGPAGFQGSILVAVPGQERYSPFWTVQAMTWKDPAKAFVLESLKDIAAVRDSVTSIRAGPVVNCAVVPVG